MAGEKRKGRVRKRILKCALPMGAALWAFTAVLASGQNPSKKIKVPATATSFDGGMFFETDGGVSETCCFRIAGQVSAPHFFDRFERVDSEKGTEYRSGGKIVREFPKRLTLIVNVRDFPCSLQMGTRPPTYLTPETMAALHWGLYWKRGVEMRPISNVAIISSSVAPVLSYEGKVVHKVPGRLKWTYQLGIPSEGVPLTDSLVVVARSGDGRIIARVAARL